MEAKKAENIKATADFVEADYKGKIFKVRLKAADMWSGVQLYDGCRVVLYPSIDKFGRTVTGLEDADQKRLEESLGFEPGYLKREAKFWKDFSVQVDSSGLELDTNDPYQELQYLFLRRSKRVSKSTKAISNDTVVVMYCEQEEAKTSNVDRGIKVKAFKKFAEMSHDDMKKILVFYGKRATNSMANDVVEDTLGTEIELNPKKFWDIISDPLLEKKMFVNALHNKGVIKKVGNRYVYGEYVLGADIASVDRKSVV